MEQWIPLIIAIVSVSMMLCGNYCLQKKMIATHNKEKAIDLLIKNINELKDLYFEYWQNARHDATRSLQIKIKQTLLLALCTFANKKYSLVNKDDLDLQIMNLINKATGDEFDSKQRKAYKHNQCIEISNLTNKVVIAVLHNKI